MEWITVTAPTVNEAKEHLLDKLGVPDGEAEFVVEEEGESKFFGLRKSDARVRARVVPRRTESPRDRKRGRNDRNRSRSSSGERAERAPKNAKQAAGSSAKPTPEPASKERTASSPARRGSSASQSRKEAAGGGQTSNKPKDRPKVQKQEIPMDEVTTNVRRFLDGLIEAFGVEGSTELSVEEEVVSANITGQHGVLVGPKGRTLDAVQELTKIAAFKGGSSPARIRVDVGNYRAKRADALARFADKAAQKARTENTEVTLEPMSPADRKVVHDALSGIEGIETRSVGTDPRRRVVISPLVE